MPITVPAAPARKRTPNSPAPTGNTITPTVTPLTPKGQERSEGLRGWAQIVSIGCLAKGWYADAGAIGIHGPTFCDEVARLGENDERIGKGLDWLAMSGPYAALMAVSMNFGLQLLVNHGRMNAPAGMDGVLPKEALEARVKAEIAKAQAAALREQQQAEQELAEAQSAMASMNGDGSS